jgi:hypothetical protein
MVALSCNNARHSLDGTNASLNMGLCMKFTNRSPPFLQFILLEGEREKSRPCAGASIVPVKYTYSYYHCFSIINAIKCLMTSHYDDD